MSFNWWFIVLSLSLMTSALIVRTIGAVLEWNVGVLVLPAEVGLFAYFKQKN